MLVAAAIASPVIPGLVTGIQPSAKARSRSSACGRAYDRYCNAEGGCDGGRQRQPGQPTGHAPQGRATHDRRRRRDQSN